MAAPDHLAAVRGMRALAGRNDVRVDDLHAAVRRLESIVGSWRTFGVRPASLIDAANLVEGLRRSIVELREAPHDAS